MTPTLAGGQSGTNYDALIGVNRTDQTMILLIIKLKPDCEPTLSLIAQETKLSPSRMFKIALEISFGFRSPRIRFSA